MAKAPPPSLLLSFDFDGTLLHHESEVVFHPQMNDALRAFQSRGAKWLINTGRSLSQTLQGLQDHHVYAQPDYIIAQECEIYHRGIFGNWKDFGAWNKAARRAHHGFVKSNSAFLAWVQNHLLQFPGAQFLQGDLGNVGIVAVNDAQLTSICVELHNVLQTLPLVGYHRNGRYLRFSHSKYSKGSALQELANLLAVDVNQIFAAGDNYNDLQMLDPQVAKYIACPSNALDPIKDHVRNVGGFVASHPASCGMLEALNHFFKLPISALPTP